VHDTDPYDGSAGPQVIEPPHPFTLNVLSVSDLAVSVQPLVTALDSPTTFCRPGKALFVQSVETGELILRITGNESGVLSTPTTGERGRQLAGASSSALAEPVDGAGDREPGLRRGRQPGRRR